MSSREPVKNAWKIRHLLLGEAGVVCQVGHPRATVRAPEPLQSPEHKHEVKQQGNKRNVLNRNISSLKFSTDPVT